MDSTPCGSSIGCIDNFMGQNVCICISSDLPGSTSLAVHETISMHNHTDCPNLAQTPLVPGTITVVSSKSDCINSSRQSVEPSSVSESTPKPKSVSISGMVAIDKHLSTEGFPKKARFLLKSSWRSGTQQDYNSKFKKFRSWCVTREIEVFSATIAQCADF
ncbi:hypothetical protein DPMN_094333 [Dreissena polymorpha]|uniref:Uncharacterized protein n=1 Tax=Dreissena polymorpha TaxID=45954 RepID=A0A9D4L7F9_DREPO|nr:hypothetical protein DPMN_094333 [Dreissena polymorpha]